ncbi:MAG: aminotransferase class V-fold PLP-dependent enzyme [Myxococcales bacterium]|nr:MAG: aminotransferase class V-fold PLP-dependent enzyme [Myxococcales bacterium]
MIYLDNAATTYPKPDRVIEAMTRMMRELGANPGRAAHRMAVSAEREITAARHLVARFFNLRDPLRVVFTHNCTDALNFALKGVLEPGDHVVTTDAAHNSVSRPLEAMADRGLITLTRLPLDAQSLVDPDAVFKALRPKTKLVEITHGSNVTGAVQPLAEIGLGLRQRCDALLLVDAAQTAGVLPLDMEAMGIDLLALPGHKGLFGPPGTGLLLIGERARVKPWREGGTGGDSAARLQPTQLPFYWESGTPNTAGIAGLAEGLRFVEETGLEAIQAREKKLMRLLLDGLRDDDRFRLFGPGDVERQVGVFSFLIRGQDPHQTGAVLDSAYDIAIRTGLHCAPYIHKSIGSFAGGGTARISLSYLNTEAEVARTLEALREIAAQG